MCVCVCVCVCARARVRLCVCACVRACVLARAQTPNASLQDIISASTSLNQCAVERCLPCVTWHWFGTVWMNSYMFKLYRPLPRPATLFLNSSAPLLKSLGLSERRKPTGAGTDWNSGAKIQPLDSFYWAAQHRAFR